VAEEIQAMLAPHDTMKIKSIDHADALLQKLKGTPAGGGDIIDKIDDDLSLDESLQRKGDDPMDEIEVLQDDDLSTNAVEVTIGDANLEGFSNKASDASPLLSLLEKKNLSHHHDFSIREGPDHDNSLGDDLSLDGPLDDGQDTAPMKNGVLIAKQVVSRPNASNDNERSLLLLYLNDNIFMDEGDNMKGIIQAAKDMEIDIVLVLEQDRKKGGCEFTHFFKVTPQILIDRPYELYREIAIPLYTTSEYRIVSLHQIIRRMGRGAFK
jgi:hypothetical protein